jgi:hypothetical protein
MTISWPTAAVICVTIAAVVATALAGPSVGLDAETIATLLSAQGVIGALAAGLLRQLLSRPDEPRRAEPIWAPERPREPPSEPPALAVLLVALAGTSWLASGCSSGPQLPIVTTPISISCTWHAPDGGTIEDCDCLIDRSSAAPATATTGVQTETRDVAPSVSVPVGGGTP